MVYPEGQLFGLTPGDSESPTISEIIRTRIRMIKNLTDTEKYQRFIKSLDEHDKNAILEMKEYTISETMRSCVEKIIESLFNEELDD